MPRVDRLPRSVREALSRSSASKQIEEEKQHAGRVRLWKEMGQLALFLAWHWVLSGDKRKR
jgi:hypothetical protein